MEKKVDRLGRIVIPIELREKYGLDEGVKIEFHDVGDGITLKASEPFCKICRTKISESDTLPLYEKCIAKIIKEYK